MRTLVVVATLAMIGLAGCGGDDDCCSGDGGTTGFTCGGFTPGTVSGSVLGAQISPVRRAEQIMVAGVYGIVIDEVPAMTTCDNMNSDTGEHVVLYFCSAPTAGSYTVTGLDAFSCPGMITGALIEQNGGSDLAEATGGSVTISGAGVACVEGTFSLQFGTEMLAGSFDATVCP